MSSLNIRLCYLFYCISFIVFLIESLWSPITSAAKELSIVFVFLTNWLLPITDFKKNAQPVICVEQSKNREAVSWMWSTSYCSELWRKHCKISAWAAALRYTVELFYAVRHFFSDHQWLVDSLLLLLYLKSSSRKISPVISTESMATFALFLIPLIEWVRWTIRLEFLPPTNFVRLSTSFLLDLYP